MTATASVLLDDLTPEMIERLPDEVLTKLGQLRTLRDDSRELYLSANAAYMRLREPGNDLVLAERELAEVTGTPVGKIVDAEFHGGKKSLEQQEQSLGRNTKRNEGLVLRVAALKAQHDQARHLRDERGKLSLQHQALYERVIGWFNDSGVAQLILAEPVDLAPFPDLQAELQKTRTLIASLRGEERRLLRVGVPMATVEQRVTTFVQTMADRVSVGGFVQRDVTPSIILPDDQAALALLSWLDPKAMARRLVAEAKESVDFTHALSDLEWEEQKAKLVTGLHDAELREEAIISRLSMQGTQILRRSDASPRAVLQLALGGERHRRRRAA